MCWGSDAMLIIREEVPCQAKTSFFEQRPPSVVQWWWYNIRWWICGCDWVVVLIMGHAHFLGLNFISHFPFSLLALGAAAIKGKNPVTPTNYWTCQKYIRLSLSHCAKPLSCIAHQQLVKARGCCILSSLHCGCHKGHRPCSSCLHKNQALTLLTG